MQMMRGFTHPPVSARDDSLRLRLAYRRHHSPPAAPCYRHDRRGTSKRPAVWSTMAPDGRPILRLTSIPVQPALGAHHRTVRASSTRVVSIPMPAAAAAASTGPGPHPLVALASRPQELITR